LALRLQIASDLCCALRSVRTLQLGTSPNS
jgi:hypothetical protein